jgi:hypothetical protein
VLVLPALAWLLTRTTRPAASQRRLVLLGVLLYAFAAAGALGWGLATA